MSPDVTLLVFQLALVAILLFLNGFFVSVEFAYITVPRPRIDQLVESGNKAAQLVQRLIGDTDRVLAASQIGITVASLGIGWVGENATEKIIHLFFAALPIHISETIARGVGVVLAFSIITALHVVLGEQAPKIVAIRKADQFSLWSARAVAFFDWLARPLVALLDYATDKVVRLVGIEPLGAHQTIYTVDELKQLVEETEERGELEPHEKEMIHNVFEFDDKLVREVMVPRTEMIAIEQDTTIAEFLQTFSDYSHSRFPLFDESIDNVVGFVAIKDVLRAISSQGARALDDQVHTLMRPALFVPESKRIGSLFSDMKTQNISVAIVVDEFGGTAGMVTGDQLVEEIVGRVADDFADEDDSIETIDEKTAEIDAQLRIDEANEELGIHLPENDNYETVAGLMLYHLKRIPKEGESFKIDNVKLTVIRMMGPKIERIQVTRQ
jgi:CBS domain containing-hemolysin-like protein